LELIVLKKEVFNQVKKELQYIGLLFLLVLIVFKIAFLKEGIIALLRTVLSIFWLFVFPGYVIMLYWKEKLAFMERFIIGIMLSAAIIGIASYYLGLIGLNLKFHGIILPAILMLIGIIALSKRKEHQK
jgi:uncharacterized membrane protein